MADLTELDFEEKKLWFDDFKFKQGDGVALKGGENTKLILRAS